MKILMPVSRNSLYMLLLLMNAVLSAKAQHDYLLDETYGVDGAFIYNWTPWDLSSRAMKDSNDRIIFSSCDLSQYLPATSVFRIDNTGHLDQEFATEDGYPGIFAYQPTGTNYTGIPTMCLTSTGKIVVAQVVRIQKDDNQQDFSIHVFRLHDDGTLDSTFGTDGVLYIQGYGDVGRVMESPNGDLVMACFNAPSPGMTVSDLIRISPNGSFVDFDYANDALSSITEPYIKFTIQQLLGSEDKLTVISTGTYYHPTIPDAMASSLTFVEVFRIDIYSGELDTSFGEEGSFSFDRYEGLSVAYHPSDADFTQENEVLLLLSYAYDHHSRLIKIDNNGQLVTTFGIDGVLILDAPESPCNHFYRLAKHPSHGWYITGSNDTNTPCGQGSVSIAQLNEHGIPIAMQYDYNSIEISHNFSPSQPTPLVQSDGKLLLVGYFFHNGPPDLKAIRINAQLVSNVPENPLISATAQLATHPNPATNYLRVKLEIPQQAAQSRPVELVMHDLQGRVVYRQNHPELQFGEVSIDVSQFPSGLYTLHCTVDGVWVDATKIVVE